MKTFTINGTFARPPEMDISRFRSGESPFGRPLATRI
jgi:hypothetical protein